MLIYLLLLLLSKNLYPSISLLASLSSIILYELGIDYKVEVDPFLYYLWRNVKS
jgi:hypothetical protein